MYIGASKCPDANMNANVDVESGSLHGPIGVNASVNEIERTGTLTFHQSLGARKHATFTFAYRMYGIALTNIDSNN